jgi:hypothetical protein
MFGSIFLWLGEITIKFRYSLTGKSAMTYKHAELTCISKYRNMINFVDLLEKATVIGKFFHVKLFMVLFKGLINFSLWMT